MATISDMSHVMNLGNFESLIALCISSGEKYNPSTLNLTVNSLQITEIEANKILKQVKVARINFNHDDDERRLHFTEFKELIKKVINLFLMNGTSEMAIATVVEIQKRIIAIKENSIKKNEIPAGNIGASPILTNKIMLGQVGYISLLNNFKNLLELLKQENNYKTNDPVLKKEQLQATLISLVELQANAINSEIILNDLKITRSNYFYAPETGMVTIALNVKKYIKATFGSSSNQFKLVNQLKFINIKIYEL